MSVAFRFLSLALLAWLQIGTAEADRLRAAAIANFGSADARPSPIALRPSTQFAPEIALAWFDSRVGAGQDGRFVGFRPLHAAALNNDVEAALRLIESGARLDATDASGRTPLMVAAAFGNVEVTEVLLNAGADPALKDQVHGDTALHFAAMAGRNEVVAVLLQHGSDVDRGASANGETPLHYAALYGHLRTIELLVAKGAKVDATDNEGVTPLQYASKRYREPAVALLLSLGARPEDIFDAVNAGNIGQVYELIQRGADVNALGLFGTPLHLAASQGRVAIAAVLIEAGADIEAEGEPVSAHPLHLAALNNQPEMAKFLIERGADVDARDAQGRTPLIVAAVFGSAEVAQRVLAAGADPMARDGVYRDHALHWAAGSGDIETAMLLLANGVDINLRSGHSGETPLHYAVCSAKLEMIEFLAENGADLNRPDDTGTRPVDYSVNNKSETAIALLISLGAER